MNDVLRTALILGTLAAAGPLAAQSGHSHGAAPAAASPAAPAAAADMAEAEVRRVDRENRKVTLRHGEIRNLQMPPMTMVFEVRDPSLLDQLKPGDRVRFTAEQKGSVYTVTTIEPAK